jgi:tRNA C32,U32 (ribose-2'-O)-methylase TrmJ
MQGMSPQDMFQQQVQSRLARTQEKELAFKEKYKPQELAIQEADLKAKREQESVDQMIRNMLAKAQIQNQEQQRTQAEKNLALEANKETAKHWLSHPLNARKAAKAIAATGQEAALTFGTESDAKNANLPKGTIVMIGGRRARID